MGIMCDQGIQTVFSVLKNIFFFKFLLKFLIEYFKAKSLIIFCLIIFPNRTKRTEVICDYETQI